MGATRSPKRPLEFEIFREIIDSDVDSFTITMDETYTFALAGSVRTRLSERFPKHCYTESP